MQRAEEWHEQVERKSWPRASGKKDRERGRKRARDTRREKKKKKKKKEEEGQRVSVSHVVRVCVPLAGLFHGEKKRSRRSTSHKSIL